jgi:hypothetical protein
MLGAFELDRALRSAAPRPRSPTHTAVNVVTSLRTVTSTPNPGSLRHKSASGTTSQKYRSFSGPRGRENGSGTAVRLAQYSDRAEALEAAGLREWAWRVSPPVRSGEPLAPPRWAVRAEHGLAAMSAVDVLLTAAQLADRWQVTEAQVYRLSREGRIPVVTIGRYRRFRLESTFRWR